MARIQVFIFLFLGGCSQIDSPIQQPVVREALFDLPKEIIKKSDKIALLIPTSGQHKKLGQSLEKAAEMSLFDHGNDQLTIAIYDTQSTVAGASKAAQRAIQEGAGIIVGPIFSNHVQAISQLSRRADINVISFSNNKSVARRGVFTLGFLPEEQVRQIIAYAATHGIKSLAVLIPRNAYGSLVEREVKRLHQQYGFDVDFISYDTESSQLTHDLNPLKTLKVDALFIPEGGRSLARLISAILYQEISLEGIQLLGTGQWDDPKLFENHTLRGAWIAAPAPHDWHSFRKKYKNTYGEEPSRLSSLSYDVISMLSVLRRHHGEKSFDVIALTQERGFDGLDGVFRLTQRGLAERKLSILEVTQNGLRVLQRADNSF